MLGSRLLLSTTFLVACAGSTRYRTELVGHGNGTVSSRVVQGSATDVVAAPGAGGIQLARGTYELALRFDVPRAQVIDWKIVCPGVDVDGQVGETFAEYRERRLEEMRREAARERERVATATSIVVGAVAPRVQANTRVGNANVRAHAHVDAHAAGVAAAHGVVTDPVELPPGDIGRGRLAASARVMTVGDGVCALQVTADDPDVRAAFTVTRIRDLQAEERMRTIAAREVAVKARGQLTAQLVTQGADPTAIERRRDAEVRVRLEAEAKIRARADLEARFEAQAIYARQEYLAYLEGKCNAEPGRRDRIEAQERRAREARLVAYAEIAQRRDQMALHARATLRAQLIALGAKERPPMPPPKPEEPGPAPFEGAEWTAGYWSWTSDSWEWQDGGWSDPTIFGETGDSGYVGVSVGVGASDGGRRTYQTGERDHRRRERDRDHRDGSSSGSWIHDSLGNGKKPDSSRDSGPQVRDHRDSSRPSWEPKDHASSAGSRVRDHRKDDDDDDKKKDSGPIIRDHRR